MRDHEQSKKKAAAAKDRPAQYGTDLDLDQYEFGGSGSNPLEVDSLTDSDRALVSQVGFDPEASHAAGAFAQFDNESFLASVMTLEPGIEVMSIRDAVKKYEWLSDYFWRAVSVDSDKYTAASGLNEYNGYFIRAGPGAKIQMPVQSCLIIKKDRLAQNVHNIVIAEEGSELHVITGCATPGEVERSLHLGISEFYVKRNAKLTFTMVHRWSERVDVRPRSATLVEEGGAFISSYAVLSPLHSIQTYPKVRLVGLGARAELYSVVYGSKSSKYDIGGSLVLDAPGTRGKVVSRTIATDSSDIVARGDLVGRVNGVKARLECNGLLLSGTARIMAIPQLEASAEGVELSHEATVGKLGADQLNYLMSRGLTEDEATSLIVRGFMHLKTPDLPQALQRTIDDAVRMALESGL
ncbi:MAG: SufD family Fe-S cluster assembly protein [Candidatus Thorarchaeota archaeon]|nr:SufD family Fe-S cluster assembly protein [Candidatus Thorarchaeota archaeon]